MELFDKLREPIFLKEASSAQKQLEQLQAVNRKQLPEDMKADVLNYFRSYPYFISVDRYSFTRFK